MYLLAAEAYPIEKRIPTAWMLTTIYVAFQFTALVFERPVHRGQMRAYFNQSAIFTDDAPARSTTFQWLHFLTAP